LFNKALKHSSNKNANLLRTILNLSFQIANTERNITRKIRKTLRRNTEFTVQ